MPQRLFSALWCDFAAVPIQARRVYQGISAPSAPAAGPLPGSRQVSRDHSHSWSKKAAAGSNGLRPPWCPADPRLPVPEEHLGEEVAFFPSRKRLKGCEFWQGAQPLCPLRRGAVTSQQASCVPCFLHCGGIGCVSLAPGLPHPTPWCPPTRPTFPLFPAWQSISLLSAETGALSWDKNSHVCLPMDQDGRR